MPWEKNNWNDFDFVFNMILVFIYDSSHLPNIPSVELIFRTKISIEETNTISIAHFIYSILDSYTVKN